MWKCFVLFLMFIVRHSDQALEVGNVHLQGIGRALRCSKDKEIFRQGEIYRDDGDAIFTLLLPFHYGNECDQVRNVFFLKELFEIY